MTFFETAQEIMTTPIATFPFADIATLLGVLTPLIVVPLGLITFYLRALREQHDAGRNDLDRRLVRLEQANEQQSLRIGDHERDFTPKEDWLRESMLARQNIDRITRAFARLESAVANLAHHPRCPNCTEYLLNNAVRAAESNSSADQKESQQ